MWLGIEKNVSKFVTADPQQKVGLQQVRQVEKKCQI